MFKWFISGIIIGAILVNLSLLAATAAKYPFRTLAGKTITGTYVPVKVDSNGVLQTN